MLCNTRSLVFLLQQKAKTAQEQGLDCKFVETVYHGREAKVAGPWDSCSHPIPVKRQSRPMFAFHYFSL